MSLETLWVRATGFLYSVSARIHSEAAEKPQTPVHRVLEGIFKGLIEQVQISVVLTDACPSTC